MAKHRQFKISPSILSADFTNLESEIAQINPTLADYLHVDVMDGSFVPNITMGPMIVSALKRLTSIPLDVHLMIVEPDRHIDAFVKAGASILTVHAEACTHLQKTLASIRAKGIKAGVSLNPATPVDCLKHVLDDLDLILLMTVNPGFGGQKFIGAMLDKIKEARQLIGTRAIELEVDGGIKLDNVRSLYDAGANVFVAGSAIFEHPPYNETLQKFRMALAK